MNKKIELRDRVTGVVTMRFWYCDNEQVMQTGGIVNPRLNPKIDSLRRAFTAGKDRDEESRKAYADKTDRFRP